jgi:hypothetical protein
MEEATDSAWESPDAFAVLAPIQVKKFFSLLYHQVDRYLTGSLLLQPASKGLSHRGIDLLSFVSVHLPAFANWA